MTSSGPDACPGMGQRPLPVLRSSRRRRTGPKTAVGMPTCHPQKTVRLRFGFRASPYRPDSAQRTTGAIRESSYDKTRSMGCPAPSQRDMPPTTFAARKPRSARKAAACWLRFPEAQMRAYVASGSSS